MKINIDGQELELRYSLRAMIIYETIMDKSLTTEDLAKYSNFVVFFYSVIKASADYNKMQFSMQYDDFLNWLDDNGGEVMMIKFGKWYLEQASKNVNLLKEAAEEETKKKGKKKS